MLFTKGTLSGTLSRNNVEVWSISKRQYLWQRKLQLIANDGRVLFAGNWNNKKEAVTDILSFCWSASS